MKDNTLQRCYRGLQLAKDQTPRATILRLLASHSSGADVLQPYLHA